MMTPAKAETIVQQQLPFFEAALHTVCSDGREHELPEIAAEASLSDPEAYRRPRMRPKLLSLFGIKYDLVKHETSSREQYLSVHDIPRQIADRMVFLGFAERSEIAPEVDFFGPNRDGYLYKPSQPEVPTHMDLEQVEHHP